MPKLFAVVVATATEYYEYTKAHPEHDQNQDAICNSASLKSDSFKLASVRIA